MARGSCLAKMKNEEKENATSIDQLSFEFDNQCS